MWFEMYVLLDIVVCLLDLILCSLGCIVGIENVYNVFFIWFRLSLIFW